MGIHQLAAMMLKQPIIAIESEQGEALAKCLIDISMHYGLTASKGIMLWVNLAGVAVMIYGPKLFALSKAMPKKPALASVPRPQAPAPGGIDFGALNP